MAACRRVYDSHHMQADCQEPGSVPVIEYGLPYIAQTQKKLTMPDVETNLADYLSVFGVYYPQPGDGRIVVVVCPRGS